MFITLHYVERDFNPQKAIGKLFSESKQATINVNIQKGNR